MLMGFFDFLKKVDYAPLAKIALAVIDKVQSAEDSGSRISKEDAFIFFLEADEAKARLASNNRTTKLKGAVDLAEAFAKVAAKSGTTTSLVACIPKEQITENTASDLERAGAKNLAQLVRLAIKPA
jgi:hypothetical protein